MMATPPMRPAIAALRSNLEPITAAVLCLLWLAGPEDPSRPEDQDQDKDQPADGGAGDAADPAEDRRRERLDAWDEAHERVDLGEIQSEQHAGHAGQYPADGEGRHHDPVDVDPHQAGDLLVLGDRPHRLARLG